MVAENGEFAAMSSDNGRDAHADPDGTSAEDTPYLWAGGSWQGVNAWARTVAARSGGAPPLFDETRQGRARACVWMMAAEQPDGLVDLRTW